MMICFDVKSVSYLMAAMRKVSLIRQCTEWEKILSALDPLPPVFLLPLYIRRFIFLRIEPVAVPQGR